jgi:pimeloyl-ACP methyl ester carboxylesterase
MTRELPPDVSTADCGEVELAYQVFGSPEDPTVLLVMGLATQMLGWDERFCRSLAAEGLRVVRFDNRDIGLSTHLDEAGMPDLTPIFARGPVTDAAYTLADMADDVVGLLDALGVERAHVVGASMGGMIAQEVALRHPERVASLVSIMSTPSVRVGEPTREAGATLFMPPAGTEAEAGERALAVHGAIGSPGYPVDEEATVARAKESFRRANNPAGAARQLAAIHASADRTAGLAALDVPTLVLHGEDDPLIRLDGGRATAEAVPGARLVTFPGMGHDLPEALWPRVVEEIVTHVRAAEA